MIDPDEYMQGTPKRIFYPPRAGKRSYQLFDDEAIEESSKEGESKTSGEGSRWKRGIPETSEKEDGSRRFERDAPQSTDDDQDANSSWWWTQATVRRSPFSPRLGKRDDMQYGVVYDDDDYAGVDDVSDNDSDNDLGEGFVISDYVDETLSPQRLTLRSPLVPHLGKRDFSFSPRLGKRVPALVPRLGKRDFAFSPRLGKRGGDFAFSPRLGKKADFAFSPRLGKRGDFAFSPRLGKRGDFAFSPRLGKRGDFAFSPRLGKRHNFPFSPRAGKRMNAFSPRLGKRDPTSSSSSSASSTAEETWRPNPAQVQQRSVAFSPRLG
ncbi:uncharacterized protein [Palaemon carinicauda]